MPPTSQGENGQVGEWLKPTDCKSVPPSEVRRFESFPVHQNTLHQSDPFGGREFADRREMNRLTGALVAYAVLGVLTFLTISDSRIRGVTLVILAMFAVKSWMRRKDVIHPDGESDPE